MRRTRRLGLAAMLVAMGLWAYLDLTVGGPIPSDVRGAPSSEGGDGIGSAVRSAGVRSTLAPARGSPVGRAASPVAPTGDAEPDEDVPGTSRSVRRPGRTEPTRSVPGDAPIRLAIAPPLAGEASVRVVGIDPRAPRALRLWRVVGDRLAPTALGRSDPSGLVEFPAVMLPGGAVELVAVPAGLAPRDPAPAEVLEVAPPTLHAPAVATRATETGGMRLLLQPRHRGGVLLLADAEGRPMASVPVRDRLDAAGRAIELIFETSRVEELPARVAQQLPDERLSPWVPLDAAVSR